MHAVLFSLKRVYQRTLWLWRPVLAKVQLTPARFDLLYIVEKERLRSLRQSDLWRALGVSAVTVSRMVRSLVEIGFIVRTRCPSDTRQWMIRLTRLGKKRVRSVLRILMNGGVVQLAVESMFVRDSWSGAACLQGLESLEIAFDYARKQLWDTARVHFPWHPED